MELFRNPKINWLGKKWYFLSFSLIFSVAGLLSLIFWHGLPLDVDFKGGTVVRIHFDAAPDAGRLASSLARAGVKEAHIVRFGVAANHEELITLAENQTSEAALDKGRAAIVQAIERYYAHTGAPTGAPSGAQPGDQPSASRIDLDNAGTASLTAYLTQINPEHLQSGEDANAKYLAQAQAIESFRNTTHDGLLPTIASLSGVADAPVVAALESGGYLSGFVVRSVESVGPQVGAQLKKQALLATVYSLLGMLVYLWFRFELIYGVAAVVAVFHDTLITIGAFSLTNQEISLTVIAAILTLIGYSMNDTIVVFDRIRENLRQVRREPLADVVNRSINQTLSRTVLTSGLTFLTALSLYLFGGEVLRPFSFALVIGILIGTYSSIAVAAPMLVAWQEYRAGSARTAALPASRRAKA
jgi:preprotein translocase subunit SecF